MFKRLLFLTFTLLLILNLSFAGRAGIVLGGKNTGPNARVGYAGTANIALTANTSITSPYAITSDYSLTANYALNSLTLAGKSERFLEVGTANIALTANYVKWSNIGEIPPIVTPGMTVNTANIASSINAIGIFGAIRVLTANNILNILENGKVGIGTTNPIALLTLSAPSAYLALNGSISGKQSGISFYDNSDANWSTSNLKWIIGNNYNDSGDGNLFFMRVSSNGNIIFFPNGTGNVGIGTANPTNKLTVAGIIESSSGGIRFPDGTTQNTAAVATAPHGKMRFTSSGNFVVPSSVTLCYISMSGGGGGGGGSYDAGRGGGGGGGAQAYLCTSVTVTPGNSISITIGGGGSGGSGLHNGASGVTSSFGSLLIAPGGSGGSYGSNASSINGSGGASGGSGGSRGMGSPGIQGGAGGSSIFGSGGNCSTSFSGQGSSSPNAGGYGGGGAGAYGITNGVGGNGSPGFCLVEW